MREAVDIQTHRVVSALQAARAPSPYGYRCRYCQKRVIFKRGLDRVPHFSHLGHDAPKNCEQYHPGSYLGGPTVLSESDTRESPTEDIFAIHYPDLYLAETAAGFSLNVLIPKRRDKHPWSGSVSLTGAGGQHSIRWDTMSRRVAIPIQPSTVQLVFGRSGNVSDLDWGPLAEGVEPLTDGVNVFRWSDDAGRRIGQVQPLFWGESYWLLLAPATKIPSSMRRYVDELSTIGKWIVCQLKLPSEDSGLSLAKVQLEELEVWLQHTIEVAASSAWIVSPFPLFQESGVWVLPAGFTVQIVVDGDREQAILVDEAGSEIALEASDEVEGQLCFQPSEDGIYTLCIDGRAALHFRLETEPAWVSPSVVDVVIEQTRLNLFDAQIFLHGLRASGRNPRSMILQTKGVHAPIFVNGENWDGLDLARHFADDGKGFEIDAGIFGNVFIAAAPPRHRVALSEKSTKKALWLLSLPEPAPTQPSFGLPFASSQRAEGLALRLAKRRWPVEFAPHVMTIWHELQKASNV